MKNYFYRELDPNYVPPPETETGPGKHSFAARWLDLKTHLPLQPTDEVLDVGCAEGLISMEVASMVKSVRGVELDPGRVEVAQQVKQERKCENVTFECGSVLEMPLGEKSYDVVLFLSVYQQLPHDLRDVALEKVLNAARRVAAVRTPALEKNVNPLAKLVGMHRDLHSSLRSTAEKCGFRMTDHGPSELAKGDSRPDHLFILERV